jgi:hypothetical protein
MSVKGFYSNRGIIDKRKKLKYLIRNAIDMVKRQEMRTLIANEIRAIAFLIFSDTELMQLFEYYDNDFYQLLKAFYVDKQLAVLDQIIWYLDVNYEIVEGKVFRNRFADLYLEIKDSKIVNDAVRLIADYINQHYEISFYEIMNHLKANKIFLSDKILAFILKKWERDNLIAIQYGIDGLPVSIINKVYKKNENKTK